MRLPLSLLAVLLTASLASAQPFVHGDIVVASTLPDTISWYSSTGALKQQIAFTQPGTMTIDAASRLYVPSYVGGITVFDVNGNVERTIPTPEGIASVVTNLAGDVYALGLSRTLYRYSNSDVLLSQWTLPAAATLHEPLYLDLAADQCVLWYATGSATGGPPAPFFGEIARFNVCTGIPIGSPLLVIPSAMGMRVLPDNRMLATRGSSQLALYDQNLATIWSVDGPESSNFSIAIDPGGSTFRVASVAFPNSPAIHQLAVANGQAVGPPFSVPSTFLSLAIYGERRAAIASAFAGAEAADVPSLSSTAIALLIAAMALLAWRRVG